jgi:hypothetical protein
LKTILDNDFRYRPSFDTDVKKTFERIRREQQQALRQGQHDRAMVAGTELALHDTARRA